MTQPRPSSIRVPPSNGCAKAASRPERIDRDLWSQMAEQGWLAVERPESAGGLGMGFVEVAVLCEQVGRHLAPVPFAGTVLALGRCWNGLGSAACRDRAGGAPRRGAGGARRSRAIGVAVGAVASTTVVGRGSRSSQRRPDGEDGWVLTAGPTRSCSVRSPTSCSSPR